MTQPIAIQRQDLEPISPEWTIRELVEWLSEDSRQHDPALRRSLMLIETALTGATWTGEPSTVALIRSLAAAVRTQGDLQIVDVLSPASRITRPVEQVRIRDLAARLPRRVA
ncbi:hypothetical protein [Microbacterium sp. WCS2018Hpa-9]|uniref:hypothetical protein n=1 Tax=Microbacterium sp. WCS2018Hpa-9 TaxID=3073635 RepID=UPI00288ABBFE|nr:hypothetical protein [Microbacterium sp. WCS2018Hpa-9]